MHSVKLITSILVFTLLLIQGVSAQTLISFENQFTDRWNSGNVVLPGSGTLAIPKGPGILTITISQEPFRRAGNANGPEQVRYKDFNQNESPDIGLFLGRTYYQNGVVYDSKTMVTDNMPLVTKERYYSNKESDYPVNIQIYPAIQSNTDHQLANRIKFEGSWELIKKGRATESGCDVYGTWNTTRGVFNISYSTGLFDLVAIKGVCNEYHMSSLSIDGTLQGPVLTGVWKEGEGLVEKHGRYTLFFRDDCCSFTGSYGTGESDSNQGVWSGVRR